MESQINFVINVEFRYSTIPDDESATPFKVSKRMYRVCNSIEEAVAAGDEVLKTLSDNGYNVKHSFKMDIPNSYRYSVKCSAKGCECIVRIENFNTCSLKDIDSFAKISMSSSKSYVKWLTGGENV